MNKEDALEAAPIVVHCCQYLLKTISPTGRTGSEARTQLGDTIAHAYEWLRANTLGPELDDCFQQVYGAGATVYEIEFVRRQVAAETPKTVGGLLVQNSIIQFCLALEAVQITDINFVSRQDVDRFLYAIQQPFGDAEEQAADDMMQSVYQHLIGMHGALVAHLVQTQRPLPRMLNYQFNAPSNTLVIAYRLYGDAGRADQVRDENKIIHPAFTPAYGQALSS